MRRFLVVAAGCEALTGLGLVLDPVLGVRGESVGPLLWPAVGAHAVLTLCFAAILRPAPPAVQTA